LTTEPTPQFVDASLRRADKALRAAKRLLEDGEPEDAVSRAYYAMFHAARAVLFQKGVIAKTHRGVHTMFGLHIVKAGLLSKEFGDMLSDAFDMRQTGDYEIFAEFESEAVSELVNNAERFIKKIRELLKG